MKILYVTPYADPAYGGPSISVRSMAETMQKQGAEVHVVLTNAAGLQDLPFEDATVREEQGVFFHYFRRTFPRGWFRAPGMLRWLHIHVGEFDLLHIHVPFTAPFRWAAHAAKASGTPYVVTTHGVLDPWSLQQKAWKKYPYLRWLERETLSGAAALHVTAPLEAGFLEALRLGPAIHCLPLSVPLPSMRDYCLQGKERIHILCIARLHPVKALPVLLGALAHLRAQNMDVVLDIGGDGDADYVTGLKQLASSLDLDGAVIWHGHVDDAQKRELYIKADCFALLSYHENFGLAAAEALAAGVAVVVSDQVGLAPDVLAYNAGKVVPAGNVMAAAEAIQSLLGKDIVQLYRIRARQLAEERYGEAFFAAGLDSLYRRVLAVNASIGCVTVAS